MTVAAVVVTFNRLGDLQVCLASLRRQTLPLAAILVIDNGSTDGTSAWLADQADLTVFTQANLGGAGGFATGLERAAAAGYDWLWCMDDDCIAAPDALERLMASPRLGPCIKNCVSVSKRDHAELAFYLDRPDRSYRKVADLAGKDLVFGVASFFNGTLISADVVRQIGVPDRRLFIWGDEVEYMTRAMKQGYPVVTVPGAIFYHPPACDREGIPWPGAWKNYYAIRNQRRVFQNLHGPRYGLFVYLRWALRIVGRQLAVKNQNFLYNFLLYLEAAVDSARNHFKKRPEDILTLRLYRWRHRPAAPS